METSGGRSQESGVRSQKSEEQRLADVLIVKIVGSGRWAVGIGLFNRENRGYGQ